MNESHISAFKVMLLSCYRAFMVNSYNVNLNSRAVNGTVEHLSHDESLEGKKEFHLSRFNFAWKRKLQGIVIHYSKLFSPSSIVL